MQLIRSILCCRGDAQPPRARLTATELTQAWSTIRQDEFSSWRVMRPGRPETAWQPPRGRQSPRRAHCCHKATRPCPCGREVWGALGSNPAFRILQGQHSLSEQRRGWEEGKVSSPHLSHALLGTGLGGFTLHPLINLPKNAPHVAEPVLHTQNRFS